MHLLLGSCDKAPFLLCICTDVGLSNLKRCFKFRDTAPRIHLFGSLPSNICQLAADIFSKTCAGTTQSQIALQTHAHTRVHLSAFTHNFIAHMSYIPSGIVACMLFPDKRWPKLVCLLHALTHVPDVDCLLLCSVVANKCATDVKFFMVSVEIDHQSSPSDCYDLIKGVTRRLKPRDCLAKLSIANVPNHFHVSNTVNITRFFMK